MSAKSKEERELEAKLGALRSARQRASDRTLARKKPKRYRLSDKDVASRTEFIVRLLDRSATSAQIVDALCRKPSADPSKPGGLGLTRDAAESALAYALKRRQKDFAKENAAARAEQAFRLRGSVSAAVADKQFGAVAALERNLARLHGTDAPPINPRPHGTTGEIVAGILGGMSEAEILGLAGEDDEQEDDE